MTQKRLGPAAWADADQARKIVCVATSIDQKTTTATIELQRLRAISRRVAMPSHLAALIAALCFGEVRA